MSDVSNMGRCVKCGKPIDMNADSLVSMEQNVPDHPEIGEQDVRDGMADAIRSVGDASDEPLAAAYEDGAEIVLHGSCYEESAIRELEATEEQLESLGIES